jgi:electron transfer flavoprotein alpha/beta subunit
MTAVLRRDFDTEMALIFDYLRGKSADEIAADEAMQIAMQAYRNVITAIVGPERAEETLARLMGELLLDYLSGR